MGRKGQLFATVVMLAASSSLAAMQWQFDPYVGADAQWRRTNYRAGFGNNLFAHTFPEGNVYGGFKFHEYFSLEGGYEVARSRTRMSILTTGDIAAGMPISEIFSPVIYKSKAKFQGPHFDLVGYYKPCEEYTTQLIGSVGVAILKGTFERRTIQYHDNISSSVVRTMSNNKSVLRLAGGLQYLFTECWGFRGMVGWENTAKIKAHHNDGIVGLYPPIVKPQNSTIYSVGLFWAY